MRLENQFGPNTLDEIIYPCSNSEKTIRHIAARKLEQNLLFYGRPGNGKTTTAEILPKLIESDSYVHMFNASKERGIEFVRKLESVASLIGCSSSGRNYILLDEADQLTTEAQKALKGIVDKNKNTMFLLTMNNFADFDTALADRFKCFSFDTIGFKELLKLANRINGAHDNRLDESSLNGMAKAATGSIRSLFRQMELELANLTDLESEPI